MDGNIPREKIEAAIKERDNSANNIRLTCVVDNFVQKRVYHAEYDLDPKPDHKDDPDGWNYILVGEKDEIRLYKDGIETIKDLQSVLDKRRNFVQRLNEFSLVELIGAVIAILVTLAFIGLSVTGKLDKDFVGIFGIIAGYYFGKNVATRG